MSIDSFQILFTDNLRNDKIVLHNFKLYDRYRKVPTDRNLTF